MRIGIDGRLWNETGVGRYIRNLVWQLQDLDTKNDYVLFVNDKIGNGELGITNKNWKIVQTNIRWHTVEEQLQFPKVLYKEDLDLVHFPYFSVPISYNRPFVITIHDLIINHYPTGKASTLPSPVYFLKLTGYKFVIKQAAQKAEHVIAVSEATKTEIEKHLHITSNKISVTYEGVDESSKSKTQNTRVEFKRDYLLYVGNAYPHKNLERLVDAFSLILREYPDITVVFVGKEDYFYKRLREKVSEMGVDNNVQFTGFLTEEELDHLYKNAVATIVPSLMEGFGLPGLEAMKRNCLVIASGIPSLKEIYQDAAVYFDPLAVESLHATIREVLENKKKFESYKEKGQKRVAFFSWKKMAEQTIKIYESCVGLRSD